MKMITVKQYALGLACTLTLLGCGEAPKTTEVSIPKAPALESSSETHATKESKPKSEPYEATVAGYTFLVPADWEEQPPKSQFVLGEFSIPGEGGPARLTLSSAGGGIEANIQRWHGQFNRGPNDPEPRESEITFDGNKGTLVELAGTFTDMMNAGNPSRSWRMLAIAVPMEQTNYFIKMTGPEKLLNARRDEFLKFVESGRRAK